VLTVRYLQKKNERGKKKREKNKNKKTKKAFTGGGGASRSAIFANENGYNLPFYYKKV
jgi:hypothetical protein